MTDSIRARGVDKRADRHQENPMPPVPPTRRRRHRRVLAAVAVATPRLAAAFAHGAGASSPPTTPTPATHATTADTPMMTDMAGMTMAPADRAAAQLATAAFQDVDVAEAAGYASTLDTLGCFQDPTQGGMGVHYLDQSLMDATVDIAHPEALVYELAA